MDKVRSLPEGTGFGAPTFMPRHSALIPFCTHLLEAVVPLLFHCTTTHMPQTAPSPCTTAQEGRATHRAGTFGFAAGTNPTQPLCTVLLYLFKNMVMSRHAAVIPMKALRCQVQHMKCPLTPPWSLCARTRYYHCFCMKRDARTDFFSSKRIRSRLQTFPSHGASPGFQVFIRMRSRSVPITAHWSTPLQWKWKETEMPKENFCKPQRCSKSPSAQCLLLLPGHSRAGWAGVLLLSTAGRSCHGTD